MSKVIAVAGYGPGIGDAVAQKFGSAGFKVALLSRTQSKLDAAAAELKSKGITAEGFSADLNSAPSIKQALAAAAEKLGPITVLHWNGSPGSAVLGSILTLTEEQLANIATQVITGFVTAIQEFVKGAEGQEGAAFLFTSADTENTELAIQWNGDGLVAAKAAQLKILELLRVRLKSESKAIFVGEVVVNGPVRGTPFSSGIPDAATIPTSAIADKFYKLYTAADKIADSISP